jgi:hypothetical protein
MRYMGNSCFLSLRYLSIQILHPMNLSLQARNLPNLRGVGLSAPLACFALSASIFSLINSLFFKDDTYHFLQFIAISTGLCLLIGSSSLDPISFESTKQRNNSVEVIREPGDPLIVEEIDGQVRPLDEETPLLRRSLIEPDIGGRSLILHSDAQLLFCVIFFLGGAGLMYINNVGIIIKVLYTDLLHQNPPLSHSSHELQRLQNLHVSLLSIFSCIGRLWTGMSSDITKSLYNVRRLWFLIIAGIFLLIGQMMAGLIVSSLEKLWIASICIGFGYGCIFGVAPAITSEWFGLRQFGLNWGLVSSVSA